MASPPVRAGTEGQELIALAVVTRPQGLRGEVRLHPHNPDSTLLLELDRVLLRREGEPAREVKLAARTGPKGSLIARLAGTEGRDAAESLRGAELCVRREQLPPTDEDEWYHVDLIGLAVHQPPGSAEQGSGQTSGQASDQAADRAGEVLAVIPYPSVDCLRVRFPDGVREVPMIEPWLLSVDLDAGLVVVDRLEDLPLEKVEPTAESDPGGG